MEWACPGGRFARLGEREGTGTGAGRAPCLRAKGARATHGSAGRAWDGPAMPAWGG